MKTFLLSCPCSADIPVSAGLAGGRVDCPSCGRSIDVPKWRELAQLREQPAAPATQTRWSPAHAVFFAGAALAAACFAAAALVLPRTDIAVELEDMALKDDYFISRKLYPNVDFYSGLIYQALGFPVEMFTVLFAIPRTVGWLAHMSELLKDKEQKISRPRQWYTGVDERSYVAIAKR